MYHDPIASVEFFADASSSSDVISALSFSPNRRRPYPRAREAPDPALPLVLWLQREPPDC